MQARSRHQISSVVSPPYSLRQSFSWNWELTDWARLAAQPIPEILLFHFPSAGTTESCLHPTFSNSSWKLNPGSNACTASLSLTRSFPQLALDRAWSMSQGKILSQKPWYRGLKRWFSGYLSQRGFSSAILLNSGSRRANIFFCPLQALYSHRAHVHMQTTHTYI